MSLNQIEKLHIDPKFFDSSDCEKIIPILRKQKNKYNQHMPVIPKKSFLMSLLSKTNKKEPTQKKPMKKTIRSKIKSIKHKPIKHVGKQHKNKKNNKILINQRLKSIRSRMANYVDYPNNMRHIENQSEEKLPPIPPKTSCKDSPDVRMKLFNNSSANIVNSGNNTTPPIQLKPIMSLKSVPRQDEENPDNHQNPIEIGRGTFGTVTKVLVGKQYMAKKTLRHTEDGIDHTSLREVNALSTLSHPFLMNYKYVEVTPEGTIDIYFPLAKQDLYHFIQTHSYEERCLVMPKIAFYICMVLNYIHGRNIIHRDVKPSNILIDHKGMIYLSDFGACKNMNLGIENKHGDVFMTPDLITYPYRPPEVNNLCYNKKADIYSLGATLIHVICGVFPYKKDETPPLPNEWISLLKSHSNIRPVWFDMLVRMIHQDPSKRPSTMEILKSNCLKYNSETSTFKNVYKPHIPPPGKKIFVNGYCNEMRSRTVDWIQHLTRAFNVGIKCGAFAMILFDDVMNCLNMNNINIHCVLCSCFRLSCGFVEGVVIDTKEISLMFHNKFSKNELIRTESNIFCLLNFRLDRRPIPHNIYTKMPFEKFNQILKHSDFYI